MNKLERMTAVLLYLQESPRTAREIAEHFEVSRRTILRDVQALCEMGVPLIARDGVHGGYALPAGYSLAPLGLDLREAFLLLLALRAIRRPADVPFGRERASLEAKLRALLPAAHRAQAEKILADVAIAAPAVEHRGPFLDVLLAALEDARWVEGRYRSARRTSSQLLFPRGLSLENGLWYLQAHSQEHAAERTYRVDRFETLAPLDPPRPPPEPLEAVPYARESDPLCVAALTRKGAARLDSDPRLAGFLQRRPDGSARFEFHFPAGELDWYAHLFAGLGEEAAVEGPPELRAAIAELAQNLFRTYSDGDSPLSPLA